jgi:hypothetical protein
MEHCVVDVLRKLVVAPDREMALGRTTQWTRPWILHISGLVTEYGIEYRCNGMEIDTMFQYHNDATGSVLR